MSSEPQRSESPNHRLESPITSPTSAFEQWVSCQNFLKTQFTSQQFLTWIDPISFLDASSKDNVFNLILTAPNRYKQTWAREQLIPLISQWYKQTQQLNLNVEIRLTADLTQQNSSSITTNANTTQDPISTNTIRIVEPVNSTRLNNQWTFETFVAGKANQLARAAALQVAENPGSGYNPLFIYGGVGLGKSHLIHAVGNGILQINPNIRIRYIHAETYVSDVVKAYQRKSFDDFKKYYHSLDLLLIDDIQFFAGKTRTQEEFFYAFEALIAAKKQLIITSDTYPTEIGGIDMRLLSRFGSGLTVAIEPPELEMRVAILMKKAEVEKLNLGEDEAFFIARQLRSNVRELEGALRSIVAYCQFNETQPTLEHVKEALKDLLSIQKTSVSVENIQKIVADFYKLKVAEMYSKRRPASIALPRQIAMYLAKELTQKSLPEIGDLFGGRDHTTVIHAVKKINALRQQNPDINRDIHILEQQIRT